MVRVSLTAESLGELVKMHIPGLAIKFQSEFANGARESRRLTINKVPVDLQKFSSPSKEPKGASYSVRPIRIHHSSLSLPQASPTFLHSVMNMSLQTLKQAHMSKVPVLIYTDLGQANTHVCKLTLLPPSPKTKYYTSALVETNCQSIKDFFLIHLREKSLTTCNSESHLAPSPPS